MRTGVEGEVEKEMETTVKLKLRIRVQGLRVWVSGFGD